MSVEATIDLLRYLRQGLENKQTKDFAEHIWTEVTSEFEKFGSNIPNNIRMKRRELSFHEDIKFLIYACLFSAKIPGDILEIGVWKGKSMALMSRASSKRIIGIDPMEIENQFEEFKYYKERIFPQTEIIRGYSEFSAGNFQTLSKQLAILHIDGGHLKEHVTLDFLLYSRFVAIGGFVVFDDYRDNQYSPEVGPAIDGLRAGGYFNNFHIIGPTPEFPSNYILIKRS